MQVDKITNKVHKPHYSNNKKDMSNNGELTTYINF